MEVMHDQIYSEQLSLKKHFIGERSQRCNIYKT